MKHGWLGGLTDNPNETIQLGIDFSTFIEKGDIFAFVGDLASGKTTFVKGILKGLKFNQSYLSFNISTISSIP